MNEREALLRAVCENPDDDLPRLVFADWLEEHDEPERAEFIRVQVDMDQLQKSTIPWFKLRDRARRLLQTHEKRWRSEVYTRKEFRWPEFRHGFLDQLIVLNDFEGYQEEVAEQLAATPIRELYLRLAANLMQLGYIPHIDRPSLIRTSAVFATDDEVREFLASPGGQSVRRLELINGVYDNHACTRLVEALGRRVAFPII